MATTVVSDLLQNITTSTSGTISPEDIKVQNFSEVDIFSGGSAAIITDNATEVHNETHAILEGGFLTGRNPFVFIPTVPLPTFIIQLLVIVVMSRLVKLLLSPIKQPAVIAEIISGILLGPTVLGHIPHFTSTIFPSASLPFLNLMSNFGLVLFLFLVGLELDPQMLRKSIKKSFAISLAGMALPFLLGCGTSYILFEYIEPESHRENSFVSYLLFLGVAMAITAFPVLARILTELNLLKTKVGSITISAAAVDDATSWCLLALVISIINANSYLTALYVFLMGLGYSALLILLVRPIFIACLQYAGVFEQETPSQASMFFALMLVFISAFITDAIGIHAIFGGFIAGIIMPHEAGFAYHITEKLEDVVQILFLPLYFALSGLKTKIGTLDDPLSWGVVMLVIAAACCGKIIGCTLAARMTKLNWRESFTVGTLMNCKGLVELIVLNLGYDSGVISDKTFAIMVIMALVTTFITVPMVNCLLPPEYQNNISKEHGNKFGCENTKKEPTLMVSVNRIEQVGPLLSVVNILQHKMNNEKKLEYQQQHNRHNGHRKNSDSSNPGCGGGVESTGSLKLKPSFSSIAEMLHIIPGSKSTDEKHVYTGGITINVLRLIELTERDSSVMLSASRSALSNDPITKVLKAFCEVSNKANIVQGLVKVVVMPMYGRVLAQAGEQENAQYILVPWSGSGSVIEDVKPPRPISTVSGARRRHSIHTPLQHASFIQDLLSEAKSNVVIFVDRGGPVVTRDVKKEGEENEVPDVSRKQIYLPFFGGKDDREALSVAMGLSRMPNVKINVIRYKNVSEDKQSIISGATCSDAVEEGRDVIGAMMSSSQVAIQMEDEDEKMLQFYFGGTNPCGGRKSSGNDEDDDKVFEMPDDEEKKEEEEEDAVQYSEVESFNPVSKALQHLVHLHGSDLVLVGRGNMKLGDSLGIHYRNEDVERRKVLGDFAEAVLLCHCTASLVVMHSNPNFGLRNDLLSS